MFIKLLWKEWSENLWKLLFCTAVSAAFIFLMFRIRIITDEANCLVISTIQMFVVPIVYSLDIFSGEMSNKTIHLLFKIPVNRSAIFFSKYILSVVCIFMVFLISGILMELVTGAREIWAFYLFKKNLVYGLTAVTLFAWFALVGCHSRTEAGSLTSFVAALIGLSIVYIWSDLSPVLWVKAAVPLTIVWPKGVNPDIEARVKPLAIVISQLFTFVAVSAVACLRYTRIRRYA